MPGSLTVVASKARTWKLPSTANAIPCSWNRATHSARSQSADFFNRLSMMDANHTTQYYPNKQVKRRRTSSMRTIYGSEDARRLRWCRPTGLQASLPCVVVAKSRTQQFRHPGHFGLTSTGNAVTLGLGMCSQSAPPICIAASQLRRVRVTYNKLTLMGYDPPVASPPTGYSAYAILARHAASCHPGASSIQPGAVNRRMRPETCQRPGGHRT